MGLILELSNDITVWLPFGVTLGAIALAGSLALVVLAMRARSDALLRRAASRSARADARYQKEAAIVSADPGALFVWRNIGGEPIARTGAASVLAGVLDADDKGELQDALTTLGTGGSMFSMTVPGSDGRVFQAYGKPTAGQAALWLRDVTPDAESNYNLTVRLTASEEERARLGDLLDVAPMPVWRRDENLNLVWANRAYVEAVDPPIGADVITDQSCHLRSRAADEAGADREALCRREGSASRPRDLCVSDGWRRGVLRHRRHGHRRDEAPAAAAHRHA
jgi:PAS domain-containing protein